MCTWRLFRHVNLPIKQINKRSGLIFQLNFGVRQGYVLSPALFAVYLDDLSNLFILERHKLIILYADDILIIAPSITGLERMLHACERELHWL